MFKNFIILFIITLASSVLANDLTDYRIGEHKDFIRVVFELSERPRYTVQKTNSSITLEIQNLKWKAENRSLPSPIKSIYPHKNKVIIDLENTNKISEYLLSPLKGKYRLVIDIYQNSDKIAETTISRLSDKFIPTPKFKPERENKTTFAEPKIIVKEKRQTSIMVPIFKPAISQVPIPVFKPTSRKSLKKPIIIIDAGHGGLDPGAISITGRKEKHVTIKYAKELKDYLNKTGKYKAVLTRDGDTFIKLRDRIKLAHKYKGDMFISLHADSSPNRRARGLSVYTLSETASDKEAELLAQRENKVDIIMGLDLSNHDKDVANILIDLAQRETKNKSTHLAQVLLSKCKGNVRLLRNRHMSAGFAVLKSPDIPSVLVELGFLTNKDDDWLLNRRNHREKTVKCLANSIDYYFKDF